MTNQVAIFETHLADGTVTGCMTRAEFDHWTAQGVCAPDDYLGKIIGHEDARADDARRAAWAREAA